MNKFLHLKVVGVTPDQLQKLHTFADQDPNSCLPYHIIDDVSNHIYSLKRGVPCVKILSSKYEAIDGFYRVEVRVLTAVYTKRYKHISEPKDAPYHESKTMLGFCITASSNILDAVLKILELSPVKESVIEDIR